MSSLIRALNAIGSRVWPQIAAACNPIKPLRLIAILLTALVAGHLGFAAISVPVSVLPTGQYGVDYRYQIPVEGATPELRCYINTTTRLPVGLDLARGCLIAGTPREGGVFNVRIDISDQASSLAVDLRLEILAGLSLTMPAVTAKAGLAYSNQVKASGGVAPYRYQIYFGGNLPLGLELNPLSGLISGTPRRVEETHFRVEAEDSTGAKGSADFSIKVVGDTVTVGPASATLPEATTGQPYTLSFTASGGVPPYRFEVSGLLPGLVVSEGGLMSGTPNAGGTYRIEVRAFDSALSQSARKSYELPVRVQPAIVGELPPAYSNEPFRAVFHVTGLGADLSVHSSGSIPTGLTLNVINTTFELQGRPAAPGTYRFQLNVSDQTGRSVQRAFELVVLDSPNAVLFLLPESMEPGVVGEAHNVRLTAYNGKEPTAFSLGGGALPPGLTVTGSPTGGYSLIGTPTTAGRFSFQIQARDADGRIGFRQYSMAIAKSRATISPDITELPAGEKGKTAAFQFPATGGEPPYFFSITGVPGMVGDISSSWFSGTPTEAGDFVVDVRVQDSLGLRTTRTYGWKVIGTNLSLSPTQLPPMSLGAAYSQQLTASGGMEPYRFTIPAGHCLPPGVNLSEGGLVSGRPTEIMAAGAGCSIKVTDQRGVTSTIWVGYTVQQPSGIFLSPLILLSARAGEHYSGIIQVTGATGSINYSVVGGTLPPGLTLQSLGRDDLINLTGIPAKSGAYKFTVQVSDKSGRVGTSELSLFVSEALLSVSPDELPAAKGDEPYSVQLSASGGQPPYKFSAENLPAGLQLSEGGLLAGAPREFGSLAIVVRVTDNHPTSVLKRYTLVVTGGGLTVPAMVLLNAQIRSPYSHSFSVSGGTPPYRFYVASGAIPPGMTLQSSGVLDGTPQRSGHFPFSVGVKDASGKSGSNSFVLSVDAGDLKVKPEFLPTATVGKAYSQQMVATGGNPPYRWSVEYVGGWPPWLTMSAQGLLSGMPVSGPSEYSFWVRVEDADGAVRSVPYGLKLVDPAGLIITPALDVVFVLGRPFSLQLGVIGGRPPYVFRRVGGSLPPGIRLEGDRLVGTPEHTSYYERVVVLEVTDADGKTGRSSLGWELTGEILFTIMPDTLPEGRVGEPYEAQFKTNSNRNQVYSTVGGVPGLSIVWFNLLRGIPERAGDFYIEIRAESALPRVYKVKVHPRILKILPSSLETGILESTVERKLTCAGNARCSFALAGGALPPGIQLSADGTLFGKLGATGSHKFRISARETGGVMAETEYVWLVQELKVTPSPLPTGRAGKSYRIQLSSAPVQSKAKYLLAGGDLPSGVTLSDSGVLSGVPASQGTFRFAIRLFGDAGGTGRTDLELRVAAPEMTLPPVALPEVTAGAPFVHYLPIQGGVPPFRFTAFGDYPTGVRLTDNGIVFGTAADVGEYSLGVRVVDSTGESAQLTTRLAARGRAIQILTGWLEPAVQGLPYAGRFRANLNADLVWTLVSGEVPGLTLDSGGLLSGTPTSHGVHQLTVAAANPQGETQTSVLTLVVEPSALPARTIWTVPASVQLTTTATGASSPTCFAVLSSGQPVAFVARTLGDAARLVQVVSASSTAPGQVCVRLAGPLPTASLRGSIELTASSFRVQVPLEFHRTTDPPRLRITPSRLTIPVSLGSTTIGASLLISNTSSERLELDPDPGPQSMFSASSSEKALSPGGVAKLELKASSTQPPPGLSKHLVNLEATEVEVNLWNGATQRVELEQSQVEFQLGPEGGPDLRKLIQVRSRSDVPFRVRIEPLPGTTWPEWFRLESSEFDMLPGGTVEIVVSADATRAPTGTDETVALVDGQPLLVRVSRLGSANASEVQFHVMEVPHGATELALPFESAAAVIDSLSGLNWIRFSPPNRLVLSPDGSENGPLVASVAAVDMDGRPHLASIAALAGTSSESDTSCRPTLALIQPGPDFRTVAGTPLLVRVAGNACGMPVTAWIGSTSVQLQHIGASRWVGELPSGVMAGDVTLTVATPGVVLRRPGKVSTLDLPRPIVESVRTAAGSPGPLVPGSIAVLAGANLSISSADVNQDGELATTLGGVQVWLGGVRLPLKSVSPLEIRALVPRDVKPIAAARLVVRSEGKFAFSDQIVVSDRYPQLLTKNELGTGEVWALKAASGIVISSANPATIGETIAVAATGIATGPVQLLVGESQTAVLASEVGAGTGVRVVKFQLPPGMRGRVPLRIEQLGMVSTPVDIWCAQ